MSRNRKGYKGKQYGKGRDKRNEQDYTNEREMRGKEGKNDLSWHAKSETLLKEAASIPWSWSTGRSVRLSGPYDCAPDVTGKYTVPGIVALRTAITPGTGMTSSDALNIAAQALYTDVRRMLKSANAYEASDVMIYLTAVGEVMAYISWLTRLYATTMLYSYKNSYLPDSIIKAQGVNPDDLHNNALEFLSRANQLIAKASCIYIPKGLDFLERCRWEYANYYSEGDDIKDQIYMITPGLFREFALSSDADYKGMLRPCLVIKSDSNYSVDTLLLRLEDMLEALIGDSDFANIAGDLMNRYGEGGVMNFSLIPQDAVMSIISGSSAYEVLEQIQNARALNGVRNEFLKLNPDPLTGTPQGTSDMFKVMQGASGLPNQYLTVKAYVAGQDTSTAALREAFICDAVSSVLNIHADPSPAKTMLITRFQNMIYGVEDAVTEVAYWVEAAADLVIEFDIVWHDVNGNYRIQAWTSGNSEESAGTDRGLMRTRPFHYMPTFYLGMSGAFGDIYSSLDITAPITVEQLRDINRIDLMSLFAVPDIGKLTGK